MVIIDGKKISQKIIESLQKLPKPNKKLAAVFVGDSAASESFLKQKKKMAEELGIPFELHKFEEEILEEDLKEAIRAIQNDLQVGGMIIQLPLPKKFNRESVLSVIEPEKDIDALSLQSEVLALPIEVIKDILKELDYSIEDKIVAVIGRGLLIGQPISEWLLDKCKKAILLHSHSDLAELKKADLVILGIGKAGLIKPEMLKPGAGVIDFGFSMIDGKIFGDFDSSQPVSELSFYTPTPGGTGPVLVSEIFKNFYKLNEKQS